MRDRFIDIGHLAPLLVALPAEHGAALIHDLPGLAWYLPGLRRWQADIIPAGRDKDPEAHRDSPNHGATVARPEWT